MKTKRKAYRGQAIVLGLLMFALLLLVALLFLPALQPVINSVAQQSSTTDLTQFFLYLITFFILAGIVVGWLQTIQTPVRKF